MSAKARREPLPGWRGVMSPGGDGGELVAGPLFLRSYRGGWAIGAVAEEPAARFVFRSGDAGAKIAAEDAARDLLDGLAAALGVGVRSGDCVWTWDDADCFWTTGCGSSWSFDGGGPAENGARFCHGCGGRIDTARHRKDEVGE